MNGYNLSRNWFNFCFENPEKIKPNHSALYLFAVEHCNRLGWKEKFGLPTEMSKEAIGIKSYNTYINTLNDLVEWGFVKMIERSKNQYSANIIALSKFDKALDKALDKAFIKHVTKQSESTSESICTIDKQVNQLNKETIKLINNNIKLVDDNLDKWIQSETTLPKLKTKTVFSDEVNNLYYNVRPLFDEPSSRQTTDQITKEANSWKDEIRKLIDIDGFDVATIEHVVRVSRLDDFWKGNFQTIKKLRTRNKEGVKYIDFFISKFKNGNNGQSKQQIEQIKHDTIQFALKSEGF